MGIDLRKFRQHHLRELWDALPSGYRLRMAVYGTGPIAYGPALTEARMLAYCDRMVLGVRASGRDVLCIVSPVDDPKRRARYKVPCWEW